MADLGLLGFRGCSNSHCIIKPLNYLPWVSILEDLEEEDLKEED